MTKRRAIYAGSFDPLTNGHVDILERGADLFDELILAVANNRNKKPTFSAAERVALSKASLEHLKNVSVCSFEGLLIDFAREQGVKVLLRGLRAVSDFEYEFQLATMNRNLAKAEVETMFLMTGETHFYLSSRLVREVASWGGDISSMVPKPVFEALVAKFEDKYKV